MVLALVLLAWLLIVVVVVALCAAAQRGERRAAQRAESPERLAGVGYQLVAQPRLSAWRRGQLGDLEPAAGQAGIHTLR